MIIIEPAVLEFRLFIVPRVSKLSCFLNKFANNPKSTMFTEFHNLGFPFVFRIFGRIQFTVRTVAYG